MVQQEVVLVPPRVHFVRRHWHILCVGLCLLVTFILGGFSVAQSVLHFQYPVWLMIPWIMVNILLFFASILLSLPYVFRLMQVNSPDDDIRAFLALLLGSVYILGALITSGTNGASGFSWATLAYMFVLLVFEIIDMVMGTPGKMEVK